MGTATEVEAGAVAATAAPAPGVLRQFLAALKLRYRIKLRLLRRRVSVRLRNVFRIDEDLIRDQLVDGLRRDLEATANALGQSMAAVNALNERLEYHEARIPRMRILKAEFVRGKRAAQAARDGKIEGTVQATHERTERHALGLLS